MRTTRNLAIAAGLLLLPALVAGGVPQYPSAWAPTPAKVDGTADTWAMLLKPLGDVPMVIAVQNDVDFLYLCFKTSNPMLKKQLVSTGLTVWLNGTGKTNTNRGYGVRYPLKKVKHGDQQTERESAPPPEEEGKVPTFVPPPPDFELIGPSQDDRRRFELGEEPVEAALGDDSGVMVVEFKLPLKGSGTYALAGKDAPGPVIALWLGTVPPKEKAGKIWRDNVNSHGEKRRPAEDAPEMTAPFVLWMQVTLAPPPPAAK